MKYVITARDKRQYPIELHCSNDEHTKVVVVGFETMQEASTVAAHLRAAVKALWQRSDGEVYRGEVGGQPKKEVDTLRTRVLTLIDLVEDWTVRLTRPAFNYRDLLKKACDDIQEELNK